MRTLILSIIPIIFIISCNSKPIKLELIPEIKDVVIPITSDQLSSYQVLSSYSDDGTEKLIAYNGSKHSLDYFDLDNSKVLKSENLFFEGPNGVGAIESIFWHNSDSIFAYERGKVHVLNESGQKVNSFDLYHLFSDKNLGDPVCNFYF